VFLSDAASSPDPAIRLGRLIGLTTPFAVRVTALPGPATPPGLAMSPGLARPPGLGISSALAAQLTAGGHDVDAPAGAVHADPGSIRCAAWRS
jgi:hypothetical protein